MPDFAPTQFKCTWTLDANAEGHKKPVSSVKFSPDGAKLASVSADKTCRIWDPHTGKLLATLEGHTKGVCDVAWAAMQNKFLCTGSDDKSVRVWDVETSECVKVLAAGTGDQDRGHTNYVMAVAFRAGADIIASASFDETAKLWNVQDARVIRTLPAHSDPVTSLDFTGDGQRLVTCSFDGLVRIWQVDNGECVKTITQQSPPPVTSVRFSPNNMYALVSTMDSKVRLWKYATDQVMKVYEGHRNDDYCINSCFSLSNGGKYIVSGSEDHAVYVWNLADKQIVQKLTGHEDSVLGVDASGDLLATCSLDKTIKIWHDDRGVADMEI